jgi:hypothetical protein
MYIKIRIKDLTKLYSDIENLKNEKSILEGKINSLVSCGIIDPMGRILPLENHEASCPFGSTGLGICTCYDF